MSYDTSYWGELEITPPLTEDELIRFAQLFDCANSEKLIGADNDVFEPRALAQLTDDDRAFLMAQKAVYDEHRHTISAKLTAEGLTAEGDNGANSYASYEADAISAAAQWLVKNGHEIDGAINWDGDDGSDSGTIWVTVMDGEPIVEDVSDNNDNPGPSWKRTATIEDVRKVLARFPLGKDEPIDGSDAVDALNEINDLLNPRKEDSIAAEEDEQEQTSPSA